MPARLNRSRLLSATSISLAVALVATGVTLADAFLPSVGGAYDNPPLKIMLQTSVVLVAGLAVVVVMGQFRESQRLGDLILVLALLLLAGHSAAFGLVHSATSIPFAVTSWGTVLAATLTAVALAAAAWVPQRRVRERRGMLGFVVAGVVAIIGVLWLITWLLRDALPPIAATADDARAVHLPATLPTVLQICAAVAYFLSAIGFARRAAHDHDRLYAWLTVAGVLGGFARVNYLLFSAYQFGALFQGDIYRLLAIAAVLAGSVLEIRGYWRRLALVAVLDDRRRIARDLHDRVAQEIAYIGRNARQLGDSDAARQIARAAERALSESRRTIAALGSAPAEAPLAVVLGLEARLAARRFNRQVELALDPGITLGGDAQEALIRIASEAVTNAARHSGASTIRVELQRESGRIALRVHDDGTGFAVNGAEKPAESGFGLTAIRERAAAIGGVLTLRTGPGLGTSVEVVL